MKKPKSKAQLIYYMYDKNTFVLQFYTCFEIGSIHIFITGCDMLLSNEMKLCTGFCDSQLRSINNNFVFV